MVVRPYNDEAVVLRSYKLGEADRIVCLFTKSHGKVRAVAKGVRKMRNRFGSRLEPCNYIDIQIRQGKGELDFIVEVEAKNQFPVIRSSLSRQDSAFSILEAVDLVSLEERPQPKLFDMLLGALNVLEQRMSLLVVPSFYLKILTLEGLGPVLDECVVCGKSDSLSRFDYEEGGMCCDGCSNYPRVSPETHQLLIDILGGKLNQVLAQSHLERTEKELAELSVALLEHRFERGLKAGRNYVKTFR